MKVVLAFDSFKGSLTAEEAVAAAAAGVRDVCPDAEIVALPLADGGEGTSDALCRFLNAEWRCCKVHDALMRPIEARYAIGSDGITAVMDMASAAGLTMLAPEERNPMLTTTFGVGEMIKDAIFAGCRRILLGIGGSATNDGGAGMLAALGVKFRDRLGAGIMPVGGNLSEIASIGLDGCISLKDVQIDVVCDVDNPLFGENGAACVYAPQKGADAAQVEALDRGLRNLAALYGTDPESPGAGAAGGLGYALLFLGAKLCRGSEMVLRVANLEDHLQNADIVVTGEGKADRQTLRGKLPFGVLQKGRQRGVKVALLAGFVEDEKILADAGFKEIVNINPKRITLAEAMNPAVAKVNLRNAVKRLVSKLFAN